MSSKYDVNIGNGKFPITTTDHQQALFLNYALQFSNSLHYIRKEKLLQRCKLFHLMGTKKKKKPKVLTFI